jgi:hypothetical protein
MLFIMKNRRGAMAMKRRIGIATCAFTIACIFLICSCRSVVCYGPSKQARERMTHEQIVSEVISLAKQNAPMSKLSVRTKTQTAWLFVWTKAGKNSVKEAIRSNPNLMLMQVENAHFMIDDAVVLFTPGIRTVRWMGIGKSGAPVKYLPNH